MSIQSLYIVLTPHQSALTAFSTFCGQNHIANVLYRWRDNNIRFCLLHNLAEGELDSLALPRGQPNCQYAYSPGAMVMRCKFRPLPIKCCCLDVCLDRSIGHQVSLDRAAGDPILACSCYILR